MKMMHFHFGKNGGAERFFVHLVNALDRRDVSQKIIIRPNRPWRKDVAPSIEVRESHFRNASLDRVLLPIHVKRTARRWQPDAMCAWMPRASRLMPKYDGCIRIARLGDNPRKLHYFKNIDVLVCNSPCIVERVRSLGWTRRTEIISNFTNTDRVAPVDRRVLGTPDGVPVVCSVGRFVLIKGLDVLIRAVALVKDAHLWLVGEGEEEKKLRELVSQLGIENRVRFAGWQKDPRPFIAASDVSVLPSSHEVLGNVILEAWAQRVPVVSTRAPGPKWFMRDGQNGLLTDIGDYEGIADAIRRILDSRELADTLVAGGTKTLADQFSEEAVANAFLRLISSYSDTSRAAA
ncbi:MAG: glycosyltransferase [Pirellulales bacterium]|nr:glycosyltransferase [Pirellulales bacterium]